MDSSRTRRRLMPSPPKSLKLSLIHLDSPTWASAHRNSPSKISVGSAWWTRFSLASIMAESMRAIVVTTIIQKPNDCLRALAAHADGHMFVVGDAPSPLEFDLPGAQWYPLERQASEFSELADLIPLRHYARKN